MHYFNLLMCTICLFLTSSHHLFMFFNLVKATQVAFFSGKLSGDKRVHDFIHCIPIDIISSNTQDIYVIVLSCGTNLFWRHGKPSPDPLYLICGHAYPHTRTTKQYSKMFSFCINYLVCHRERKVWIVIVLVVLNIAQVTKLVPLLVKVLFNLFFEGKPSVISAKVNHVILIVDRSPRGVKQWKRVV